MNFDSAYKRVGELIDKFEANETFFCAPTYLESQARLEFIDEFFIALGWDVRSQNTTNPYEQEVVIEKGQVQEGKTTTNRADYAFYKAPNYKQESFFVEAKKPSRLLNKNKEDYFQTAKYGYSRSTGISILTDFQELVVIDCRFKPEKDTILSTQIEYFNYKQFRDKTIFGKVFWLFSKEAVQGGKLQTYLENLPIPKKAGKTRQLKLNFGTYKAIDHDFLEFIELIRLDIAKAVYHSQPSLKNYELTETVQKIVDRLVFIRFLEDKNIENDSVIEAIYNSPYPWAKFVEECKRLNAKYNGIVFKQAFFDNADFLAKDNKPFKDIVFDFSANESPYNFNYIPIEIIGNIYERFLGKTIEVIDKKVNIDFKPLTRKAGGVFYTPTYIVEYIVKNTVGKLIEDKAPKDITKMSFADISCGSGSFLIGVYDYLLQYHTRYYNDNPDQAKKDKCGYNSDIEVWFLSLNQKKQILLNNIYGVDIDSQATEVAQLSLFLKLLENENLFSTDKLDMFGSDKILPNLTNNIKCGNTLIGMDYYAQTQLNLYNEEEQRKINVFDFEPSFPKVFQNGGFDAIVGNPPYVKEYTDREIFENVKLSRCKKYYQGKMDFWYFFVCYGVDLLKKNGLLGYIAPNNWVSNSGASIMRNKVIEDTKIIDIVDFGGYMVFQDAMIQTMSMIFEKNKIDDLYMFEYKYYHATNKTTELEVLEGLSSETSLVSILYPTIDRKKYLNTFLKFGSNDIESVLDKIKGKGNFELDGKKEATQGIVGAPDECFLIKESELNLYNNVEKKYLKKFYTGINTFSKDYIFYLSAKNFKPEDEVNCPNLIKHFEKHRIELTQAKIKYKTPKKPYYFLHRERIELFFKKGEKIICPTRSKTNSFLYIEDEYYVSRACFVIKTPRIDLKYLSGIFNSKLVLFWLKNRGKNLGNLLQIDKEPLLLIPIYKTEDKSQETELIRLVDTIIELKKQYHEAQADSSKERLQNQINATEYSIDRLVYSLYDLSNEDIAVIENSLAS